MTMLAPAETVYARSAMVSRPAHVATGAGVAMLRAGGSAADAAIAANAVLAVTWPQHCGPGGDLFALVHVAGEDEPATLTASGGPGAGRGRARAAQRARPRRRGRRRRASASRGGDRDAGARRRARGDRAGVRRRLDRPAPPVRAGPPPRRARA